eukprot:8797044-Pyramimonas_sp.AAC.1
MRERRLLLETSRPCAKDHEETETKTDRAKGWVAGVGEHGRRRWGGGGETQAVPRDEAALGKL